MYGFINKRNLTEGGKIHLKERNWNWKVGIGGSQSARPALPPNFSLWFLNWINFKMSCASVIVTGNEGSPKACGHRKEYRFGNKSFNVYPKPQRNDYNTNRNVLARTRRVVVFSAFLHGAPETSNAPLLCFEVQQIEGPFRHVHFVSEWIENLVEIFIIRRFGYKCTLVYQFNSFHGTYRIVEKLVSRYSISYRNALKSFRSQQCHCQMNGNELQSMWNEW